MPAHAGIHAFVAIKRAQLTRPLPVIASVTRMRASHDAKQSIFSTPKTTNKSQEQRCLVLLGLTLQIILHRQTHGIRPPPFKSTASANPAGYPTPYE
jgi:hypothetical protein